MNLINFNWHMRPYRLKSHLLPATTYMNLLLYNIIVNLMLTTGVRPISGHSSFYPSSSSDYYRSLTFTQQQKCPEGPPSQWESQLDAASKAYLAPIVFNGKLISLSEDYGGKIAATFRVRKSIKNTGSPAGTVPVNLISGSQVTLYFVRTKRGKSIPPYCPVHLNETSIELLWPGQRYIVFASSPLTSLVDLQRQQFADSDCVYNNLRTSRHALSSSSSSSSSTTPSPLSPSLSSLLLPSSSSSSSPSLLSSSSNPNLCINYLTAFTSPELHNKRSARAVRKILTNPNWARAPEVKGLNGDMRIQSGGKLRLKCKVNGNPLPWIEWFRNGKILKSKGRIRIRHFKRDKSLLEIKPVQPMDTGYYECRAMNVIAREPSIGKVRVIVRSLNLNRSSNNNSNSTKPYANRSPSTTTTSSSSPSTPASTSFPSSDHSEHAKGRPCPHDAYCLNGGTCTFYDSVGEFACQCAEGFRGQRCENKHVFTLFGSVQKDLWGIDAITKTLL